MKGDRIAVDEAGRAAQHPSTKAIMPTDPQSAVRARGMARRPEPAPTTEAIEQMLVWTARELRAERAFAWYRSWRPRAFILACPPGAN